MKIKSLKSFLAVFFVMISGLAYPQQERLNRTLLLSLQPGEQPVTSECCFALSAGKSNVYLVTNYQDKYFVYDEGQKSGPFDKKNPPALKSCPGHGRHECMKYQHAFTDSDMEQYLRAGDDGQYRIVFNGKEYGPFLTVMDIYTPPDKSWFVATVVDREMKYFLVTSSGGSFTLGTSVLDLHVSPSGTKVFASMKVEGGPTAADFMNMDMSNLSMEQLTKLMKDIEEQQRNAPPPEGFVVLPDGTRFGPFDPTGMDADNPAFSKMPGDHWYLFIGGKLYVDGSVLRDLGDFNTDACDIWLSEDGRRFAAASYDKLLFSDGMEYDNPLSVSWEKRNGMVYLNWVSFENGQDIVLYSRPL